MNKNMKHNIILIGFMGSGKTSVGERLALKLSYEFKDTDRFIEQTVGDTISNIFKQKGEEYFRTLETNVLQELKNTMHHTVLSTGGGLPVKELNAKILKESGYVIYLRTSKEITIKRLKGDKTRPLLSEDDLESKVERLLKLRDPIYERIAHKIITTDDKSFDDIVNLIMEAYLKQIY